MANEINNMINSFQNVVHVQINCNDYLQNKQYRV